MPAPPRRGIPPLMLAFAQTCAATVLLALTLPVAGRQVPQLTATMLIAITVLGTGIAYVINLRSAVDGGFWDMSGGVCRSADRVSELRQELLVHE